MLKKFLKLVVKYAMALWNSIPPKHKKHHFKLTFCHFMFHGPSESTSNKNGIFCCAMLSSEYTRVSSCVGSRQREQKT